MPKNELALKQLLREMPSLRYSEERLPQDFRTFAMTELVPRLRLSGYKVEAKIETALHVLHCLICAGLTERTVADSRDSSNRMRVQVWNAVVKAGFAVKALGSKVSRCVTLYYAQDKLLILREEWTARLLTSDEPDLLVQLKPNKDGEVELPDGTPLPGQTNRPQVSWREYFEACHTMPDISKQDRRRLVEADIKDMRQLEDELNAINSVNIDHSWKAFKPTASVDGKPRKTAFQPNIRLRAIYTGGLYRYARLYTGTETSAQRIKKFQRLEMLIDGEPVVELDYSCYHLRMLYHMASWSTVPPTNRDPGGDLYRPEQIFPKSYKKASRGMQVLIRNLIKKATIAVLNTTSKAAAVKAVHGLLMAKKDDKLDDRAYKKTLRGIVYGDEACGDIAVIDRILAAHPVVARDFFTGVGAELQRRDSRIMRKLLLRHAAADKPALGIHDSLVVRTSDVDYTQAAMIEEYEREFKLPPVVHQVF